MTALGRPRSPVPGGGGRLGDQLRLTADLGGGWRPGYHGRQWDSSSHPAARNCARSGRSWRGPRPAAAKDVSMAGIAGTAGMLAEASGSAAVLDVARIPGPRPRFAGLAQLFPGFAMLTADRAGRAASRTARPRQAAAAHAHRGLRGCGELRPAPASPALAGWNETTAVHRRRRHRIGRS